MHEEAHHDRDRRGPRGSAQQAIGAKTTRATVEEALRRAAAAAEQEEGERAARQRNYLERLTAQVEVDALASEEMWR